MRSIILPGSAGLAMVAATTSLVSAQTVPTRTLSRPEARLEQEWSRVVAIRELSDRRVVVLDDIDNVIMMTDPGLRTARRIGTQGQGPGEFFRPSALLALGGDSTGVIDNSSRSLKVITSAGEHSGVIHPYGGTPCGAPTDSSYRQFVSRHRDARGRYYAQAANIRTLPDGTFEQTNAAAIERWGESCGRDTLGYLPRTIEPNARILGPTILAVPVRPGGGTPFATAAQWVPFPHGGVAIVHPEPYRVDIVNDQGVLRAGSPISYRPLRVTETHRAAWREERSLMLSRGPIRTTFQEPDAWPRDLPPFLHNALSAGLDGRLWVQRTAENPYQPTFDIFDTAGRLVERVVLPVRSRLVGHGRDVVYLVRMDEDDLEYLERHRVR